MKTFLVVLLLTLSLGVAIFSAWHYMDAVGVKVQAVNEATKSKIQLGLLEKKLEQTQELHNELQRWGKKIENNLIVARGQITRLAEEKKQALGQISSLKDKVDYLQLEAANSQDEKTQLAEQLGLIRWQKTQLEDNLNSISSLKTRIRELKIKMRKDRALSALKIQPPELRYIDGNHGFVIKDGKSTYKSQVRIEVRPAQ